MSDAADFGNGGHQYSFSGARYIQHGRQVYRQLLEQSATAVDNTLRLISGSFSKLVMDAKIQTFFGMTREPRLFDEYSMIGAIHPVLQSCVESADGFITSIYLYNERTDLLQSAYASMQTSTNLRDNEWYITVMSMSDEYCKADSHTPLGNPSSIFVTKAIYQGTIRKGAIIIELDQSRFLTLFKNIARNGGGELFVIGSDGKAIFSDRSNALSNIETIAYTSANDSSEPGKTFRVNGEEFLCFFKESNINNWLYAWILPVASLNHSSAVLITKLLFISIMFSVLLAFITFLLSREVITPFIFLRSQMNGEEAEWKRGPSLFRRMTIMRDLDAGIETMQNELSSARQEANHAMIENNGLKQVLASHLQEKSEYLVMRLFHGKVLNSEEVHYLEQALEISTAHSYSVCAIRLEQIVVQSVEACMKEALDSTLAQSEDALSIKLLYVSDGIWFFLVRYSSVSDWKTVTLPHTLEVLKRIQMRLMSCCHSDVSVFLGDPKSGVLQLLSAYKSVQQKMESAFLLNKSCLVFDVCVGDAPRAAADRQLENQQYSLIHTD